METGFRGRETRRTRRETVPSLQKLDILQSISSRNTKMKMVRDWVFKVRGDIGKK